MPELPEVEVVRSGLEPAIRGATITSVRVIETRSLRRNPGPPADFVAALEGHVVLEVARRGKFLWWVLDSGQALVCHLGMSGQMLLLPPEQDAGVHCRVRIDLLDASGQAHSVAFVDQRIFGSLMLDELVPTPDARPGGLGTSMAAIPRSVAHIARDPLDPAFDDRAWRTALAAKRTGIKRALLDQSLLSGVGNIYADEALWASRLHYDTPADALGPRKASHVLAAIRAVFRRALAQGGTSFDAQYVNVNGQSGYFSRSLEAYGRAGEACSRCGSMIRRERFMNRSSYRCPRCQKRPSSR